MSDWTVTKTKPISDWNVVDTKPISSPVSPEAIKNARAQEGSYIKRFGTATPSDEPYATKDSKGTLEEQLRDQQGQFGNQVTGSIYDAVKAMSDMFKPDPTHPLETLPDTIGRRMIEGTLALPGHMGDALGRKDYGGAAVDAAQLASMGKGVVKGVGALEAGSNASKLVPPASVWNKTFEVSPQNSAYTARSLRIAGPYIKQAEGLLAHEGITIDPNNPAVGLKQAISTAKESVANSLGSNAPDSARAGVVFNHLSELEKHLDKYINESEAPKAPKESGITSTDVYKGLAHPVATGISELSKKVLSRGSNDFINQWSKYSPGSPVELVPRLQEPSFPFAENAPKSFDPNSIKSMVKEGGIEGFKNKKYNPKNPESAIKSYPMEPPSFRK